MPHKENLKVSTVISKDKFIKHESRTSENCWLMNMIANEIVHEVSKRLSNIGSNANKKCGAISGCLLQNAGAEYKPHYDSFDYDAEEGKKNWEPGGQRMLTALAYLNDVEEGGGTGFPNLGVEIEAKKGDVLVFHNTPPDSNKIHPKSLHAGLPVIAGEKWAINLWFRERLRY